MSEISLRRRLTVAAATVVAAAAVGGVGTWAFGHDRSGPAAVPSPVVETSFPGLAAPTGDPELAGIDTAEPPPGTVVAVAGPFDDRFTTAGLRVHRGVVSGSLHITSDVSDVLELQVLVGFYDVDGRFLGEGRATYHLDEATEDPKHDGVPAEVEEFRVQAPSSYARRVAAAAVGVPVLVNE